MSLVIERYLQVLIFRPQAAQMALSMGDDRRVETLECGLYAIATLYNAYTLPRLESALW